VEENRDCDFFRDTWLDESERLCPYEFLAWHRAYGRLIEVITFCCDFPLSEPRPEWLLDQYREAVSECCLRLKELRFAYDLELDSFFEHRDSSSFDYSDAGASF